MVFMVGFVATAASIVRITFIHRLIDSTNTTRDFGLFSLVCQVEVHISIICANMPTWTGLLRRAINRFSHGRQGVSSLHTDIDASVLSLNISEEVSSQGDTSRQDHFVHSSKGEPLTALPKIVTPTSDVSVV